MIGRAQPGDSLIDAVMGLESSFGGRARTAISMAGGASRLRGKRQAEREEVSAEINAICNARCDAVAWQEIAEAG